MVGQAHLTGLAAAEPILAARGQVEVLQGIARQLWEAHAPVTRHACTAES